MYIRTVGGSIVEVEPRFVEGTYTGFIKIGSNYVYSYKDSTILGDEELAAIKKVVSRELKEAKTVNYYLKNLARTLHLID